MVAEKLLWDFLGEGRQYCIEPAVWQGRLQAGVSTATSWLNAASGKFGKRSFFYFVVVLWLGFFWWFVWGLFFAFYVCGSQLMAVSIKECLERGITGSRWLTSCSFFPCQIVYWKNPAKFLKMFWKAFTQLIALSHSLKLGAPSTLLLIRMLTLASVYQSCSTL